MYIVLCMNMFISTSEGSNKTNFTMVQRACMSGHKLGVVALATVGNTIAVSSIDNHVRLWDADHFTLKKGNQLDNCLLLFSTFPLLTLGNHRKKKKKKSQ